MISYPQVSVIIPTYNRKDWLVDTLQSLAEQTLPASCFEVVVVDDGSVDGTDAVQNRSFPFRLHYIHQTNQGDAQARNVGAQWSKSDILVFLDDDIVVAANYLCTLVMALVDRPRRIVAGVEQRWLRDENPLRTLSPQEEEALSNQSPVEMEFAKVCSNNMALWRDAFWEIGPMEAFGFSGSSMWCDVEFAYRAFQLGFDFYRCPQAICWHRDHVFKDLDTLKRRMEEVGFRAAAVFERHPELSSHLPMFEDKTPIAWGEDRPGQVVRKVTRRIVDVPPVLWSLERFSDLVRSRQPSARLLIPLKRWIVGSYIYRGYRDGLQNLSGAKS